ncbi:polynucleotide adenylyltransferase PcnB, partial [Acinetobacter baumannii]
VIPRFAETFIREVWEMQTRLLNPKPQQIEALASHARFRAGFDFLLLREKSGDDTTQGMGSWWEAYQEMSNDEKEAAISQYNRQKAKSRRKVAAEPVESNKVDTEIEPLVDVPEPRSRRGKKERARQEQSIDRFIEKSSAAQTNVMSDHPILKRKRVQRDLSQVIFGPTQ